MPRALIVDDDPQIQAILKRLLARHGFEVDQATSGREGGKKLMIAGTLHEPYRYVFLDHDMPDDNGTELVRRMTSLSWTGPGLLAGKITFVVHSSNPDGAQRMAAILRDAHLRTRVIPKDRLVSILMFYKSTKPTTQARS